MSCTTIRADLIAACTGEVDAATRDAVDAHLLACESCRREAGGIERLLSAVSAPVVFPRESDVDWSRPLTCTAALTDLITDPGDVADETRAHLERCAACRAGSASISRTLRAITPEAVFPRESEIDWSLPLTCAAVRRDLASILEENSPERDAALEHLSRCPDCTEESARIGETLMLARRARPEERRVDWDAFAADTARKAVEQARRPSSTRAWGLRAALPVAASLVAAVGLAWLASREPATAPGTPDRMARATPPVAGTRPAETDAPDPVFPAAPGALLDARVTPASVALVERAEVALARTNTARYLSDSGNLLLSLTDLASRCDGENVDVSLEQELSTRLLRRKQFLEGDLQDVEVARAHRLAEEIEDLLVDIASLEPCTPPQRVLEIRDRVRQRQLMMRIDMISNELSAVG